MKASLIFLILFLSWTCNAEIFRYNEVIEAGGARFIENSMFSSHDAPMAMSPGNGTAYVTIDIKATRLDKYPGGTFATALVHEDYYDFIGINGKLCCSQDMFSKDLCAPIGGFAIKSAIPADAAVWTEVGYLNGSVDEIFAEYLIEKSGPYWFIIVNCPATPEGHIQLEGQALFMNPFGYLPASEYPFLPFYAGIAIAYIIFGGVWGYWLNRYRKGLLLFQHCISIVLVVSVIENVVFTVYYFLQNASGEFPYEVAIFGTLLDSIRITFSAALLLLVCKGYKITSEEIGNLVFKILMGLIAVTYLVLSFVSKAIIIVQENTDYYIPETTLGFIQIVLSVISTGYFGAIFLLLARTYTKLRLSGERVKARMYLILFGILVFGALFAFGAQTFEVVLLWGVGTLERDFWLYGWFWDVYWQGLYILTMIPIAFLWRPNPNNSKYAYAQLATGEEGSGARPLDSFQPAFTLDDDEDENFKPSFGSVPGVSTIGGIADTTHSLTPLEEEEL